MKRTIRASEEFRRKLLGLGAPLPRRVLAELGAPLPRREPRCPGCGGPKQGALWCDECRCTGTNTKGRRCGNRAGRCEQHMGET